tara:strand:- start:160 stop:621 length:462 start_codon:yes stop_codon:yes gene_type:complete
MWTIILILMQFSVSISKVDNSVYIIIDDSKSWEEKSVSKSDSTFFYLSNDKVCCVPPYYFSPYDGDTLAKVSLFHGSLDPDVILSKTVTWGSVINSSPFYSSKLNYQDWVRIESSRRNVFIIHPKDYSTDQEFLDKNRLKVYNVKVHAIQMEE